MRLPFLVPAIALVSVASVLADPGVAFAQTPAAAPATGSKLPADPWPRVVDLSNGQVLVYQPQVNQWEGNRIDFRCAMAIKPTGAKEETFGVIFANARTQVDKVARTVVFEDLKITKTDFPTLPNHGAAYTTELAKEFATTIRTISLDRLQASLALAGVKPPTVAVQEQSASGHRQLFACNPGADRRRPGAAVRPESQPHEARHQHACADLASRVH